MNDDSETKAQEDTAQETPKARLRAARTVEEILSALMDGVAAATGLAKKPVTPAMSIGVAQEYARVMVNEARAAGVEGFPADPNASSWAGQDTLLSRLYYRRPIFAPPATQPREGDDETTRLTNRLMQSPLHEVALFAAHGEWINERGGEGKHPLASALTAWLNRPPSVQTEDRTTAILPDPFRWAVFDNGELPDLTDEVGKIETGTLPGIEEPKELVPSLPLAEPVHMPQRSPGPGAPLARRFWWLIVSSVRAADRDLGRVELETTLRKLTQCGWPKGGFRRGTHLGMIEEALDAVDNFRVSMGGRWRIINVRMIPDHTTGLDDPIPIEVSMPPGSSRGAMIDRLPWWALGAKSGPLFDAWARLNYIWDAAKGANGSRRIYAQRPVVWRDKNGYLRGADGQTVRGPDPAAPFRQQKATPAGKPQKNWQDSRAVLLDVFGKPQVAMPNGVLVPDPNATPRYERNPAADKVPQLSRRDLNRLFQGDATPRTDGAGRQALSRHLQMLRKYLEDEGLVVVELERGSRGGIEAARIVQANPRPNQRP